MVEVDATIPLTGPHGPVTLLEAFEGRRQLTACYLMWKAGQPAEAQCEGCTFYTTQVGEQVRTNGRPTAQWSRLDAGRSDDLGTQPARRRHSVSSRTRQRE